MVTKVGLESRQTRQVAWEIAAGTVPVNPEYPPGNVLRYGADPTGLTDCTAAFNLATRSGYQSTGIYDENFAPLVEVPAGYYRIEGTVYVHKGQHIRGVGEGATRIRLESTAAYGDHIFRLGEGSGGVDAGGLAPEISGMWFIGGPSANAVVYSSAAGASIHNLFMTSVGIGIYIIGTDVRVTNIQIDQCLTGMRVGGHSHNISNVLMYLPNSRDI